MTPLPERGRATAASTLTGSCTVTRSGGEAVFVPGTGIVEPPVHVVYDGHCSLGPTRNRRRSTVSADDREVTERVLRLPVCASAQSIQVGDDVEVHGHGSFAVVDDAERTSTVLHRVWVTRSTDAPGVPR